MNSRVTILVLLTGLLSGPVDAAEPSAEDILSGAAPSGEYVAKRQCIVSSRIDRSEVLSDRFIVFHMSQRELWLVRLPMRCLGLNSRAGVMFEKRSNDWICEWDSVRSISAVGVGPAQLGPRCNLAQFEPVTSEQVSMLQQEIKAARRAASKPAPK